MEGLNRQTADHAHPVPTLPERVVSSFFRSEFLPAAIPVGIEKATLHVSTWNLDKAVISLILSQNIDELSATTQGIIEQLSRLDGTVTVLDGATLVDESDL